MAVAVNAELREFVASRANHICEYCLISESDAFIKFQMEHIISRKHGGSSEPENLALACVFCNLHKGSDIASISPETNELVRFFDPRNDRWSKNFRLSGAEILPVSNVGEATIRIFKMNGEDRLLERQLLINLGRYPSNEAVLVITEH